MPDSDEEIDQFMTEVYSGAESAENIRTISRNHGEKGSIVKDNSWHIFLNDAFIIGAVHARRHFHLYNSDDNCSIITSVSSLWDKDKGRFRVLGREIAMLMIADYIPLSSKITGKTMLSFIPPYELTTITISDFKKQLRSVVYDDVSEYLAKARIDPDLQFKAISPTQI
jgi:hypothetical protein